jgi:hypothetical protein
VERTFGGFDAGLGRLYSPERLEIGPRDHVYVLDEGRIVVFDSFGNFLHELAKDVFRKPVSLFADNEGIVVLDDDVLYCFDQDERPMWTIPTDSIEGTADGIRSITFSANQMYLLTTDGLIIKPDPRRKLKLDRKLEIH